MKSLFKICCLMFILKSGFSQPLQLCRTAGPDNDFLVASGPTLTNATVQVSMHIIRKTNGQGDKAVTTSEAINAFNFMRTYFIIHSICLNLIGIDFINQTSYYNYRESDFNSLVNHIVSPNAIDVFLLPKRNFGSIGYSGLADGIPARALVILGKYVDDGDEEILSHEMGHCLGLYHTHHGIGSHLTLLPDACDEGGCAEFVDGTNSANCGDFVEDTPADPCLENLVNISCQYTGTSIDPNGMTYNPQVNNIMSYTREGCAGHFTTKQGIRMLETITNTQLLLDRLVPANITLQNFTIPFNPPGPQPITFNQTFTAQNTLTAGPNVIVNPGGTLNLVAENKVILLPGFKAEAGSHFCAQIGPSCFPVPNCRIIPLDNNSNNDNVSSTPFVLQAAPVFDSEKDDESAKTIPFSSANIIPNPSNGKFTIEITNFEEIKSSVIMEIYNPLGGKVFQSLILNPQSLIDLSTHPAGIYFIKVISKENIHTQKIIISAN